MTIEDFTTEQKRPLPQLLEDALEQSEKGQWSESIETNRAILALNPEDVSALNRLGRSLTKLGRLREALEAYDGTIAIDPANAIALRNSARLRGVLENLQDDTVTAVSSSDVRAEHFIMETGRSAVLSLEDLSPVQQLATILPGDMLELKPDGPYLRVYTAGGEPVGMVPAERAHRLLELMAAGNTYSAVVLNASVEGMRALIRETYRSPQTHGKLPFPAVTRQAPEARVTPRSAELGIEADEEFLGEVDIDEDVEERDETATESLSEPDDVEEPEE